ncbi:MAG: alpha amylase C-terminal domain-containing protein, partial [Clostridia bacterium]|nr:alpha amylase C-terminal domain-containing protein [Clostridia bacterium]
MPYEYEKYIAAIHGSNLTSTIDAFIQAALDEQVAAACIESAGQNRAYVEKLNKFYRSHPSMYMVDDSWDGFKWLSVNDADNSILAFMRSAGKHTPIVSVTNFTPQFHGQYRIGLPYDCELTEVLNSDREEFSGSNQYNAWTIRAEEVPCNDLPYSCNVCVPPLSTVYFKVKKKAKKK